MGRPKGGKNSKPYKRLSPTEREALVAEYIAGAKQTDLAAKYEISQTAVSKILRAEGTQGRSPQEAQPPTFDVDAAVKLFESGLTTEEVGHSLGVSQSVVHSHLSRRGLAMAQKGRGRKYKTFDREFFAKVTHESAYFAGFIAADGCVHGENNTVSFGLHPNDRVVLENLKAAAKLEQPIAERNNNFGKPYVWMDVTAHQWVESLERVYKITPKKSLTLQPPTELGWEYVWSYVRGVFDGDGHAAASGKALQLTSGSKPFLEWVARDVFRATQQIYEQHYVTSKGPAHAYGITVTGACLRDIVPRLYEHSTPQTRLARKYDRFKAAGLLT